MRRSRSRGRPFFRKVKIYSKSFFTGRPKEREAMISEERYDYLKEKKGIKVVTQQKFSVSDLRKKGWKQTTDEGTPVLYNPKKPGEVEVLR